jgi:hypothetical protein
LLKLLLVFAKIVIITLVFEKNAIFFAENYQKSQKIVIITSTPGRPDWPNYFGLFLKIFRLSQNIFCTEKLRGHSCKKTREVHFVRFFSQHHPVTLFSGVLKLTCTPPTYRMTGRIQSSTYRMAGRFQSSYFNS